MTVERSPERDAALDAVLPYVGDLGWTMRALAEAAGPDADLLFPGGPADMVEAYSDLADRRMDADAAALDLSSLRTGERVEAVIGLRLARAEPHRDAVRRALGLLALPGNAALAVRCTARTVDTMWHAAGDGAADFSWYTKRAVLAGVYGSTLLYWLNDQSFEGEDSMAFLRRRLRAVGRVARVRARVAGVFDRA